MHLTSPSLNNAVTCLQNTHTLSCLFSRRILKWTTETVESQWKYETNVSLKVWSKCAWSVCVKQRHLLSQIAGARRLSWIGGRGDGLHSLPMISLWNLDLLPALKRRLSKLWNTFLWWKGTGLISALTCSIIDLWGQCLGGEGREEQCHTFNGPFISTSEVITGCSLHVFRCSQKQCDGDFGEMLMACWLLWTLSLVPSLYFNSEC